MPSKMQLTMRSGPTPGAVFELSGDQLTIGREPSNEIVVNDAEVSRRHARLTYQGGKYVIEDFGSTTGTFINGQRLTGPRVLKSGEVVSFGEQIVFVYEETQVNSFEIPSNPKVDRPLQPIGSGGKKACLTMRSGPNPGVSYELKGDRINIGRDATNDIPVNDAEISRRHSRLTYQGGKHVIEDLGSTNGTFVNGQRLTGPRVLRFGEVISLGEQIVFIYELLLEDEIKGTKSVRENNSLFPNNGPKPAGNKTTEKTVQTKTGLREKYFPSEKKPKPIEVASLTPKALPKKVFISYSREDLVFVKKLAKDLSAFGVDPWWDLSRIKGGDTWIRSIQSALDSSHCCIVVITPDSVESQWVEREYTYAFSNNMKVIPVYLKTVKKFPFSFSTIQHVDFRNNNYSSAIEELKIALETLK